jgi:hypothetical protein
LAVLGTGARPTVRVSAQRRGEREMYIGIGLGTLILIILLVILLT